MCVGHMGAEEFTIHFWPGVGNAVASMRPTEALAAVKF